MEEIGRHVGKNRAYWDEASAEYQQQHGSALLAEPLAWGSGASRKPKSTRLAI